MSIPKNKNGKEPTQKELLFSIGTMLFDIREILTEIKTENYGSKKDKN